MAQANFSFISDASGGDQFTVVSFSGNEAISSLYRYEIEIKAPLSAELDLDDVLDNPARFVTELDGKDYPVYGVLASFDELQTVQGYVHYRAVLVPRLWWLSIYKTNEIYTEEKTVDMIIQAVLENADFTSGTDFDLGGLDTSKFLKRDYVCQFGESDFDFISRLMENEGIFYYFEHDGGSVEKIIFINDMNYLKIPKPDLIFDVAAQSSRQHDCINAWSCRKQRLPASVSVRDFNPEQPSLDISDTMPIDNMGQGTEYIYGVNVKDGEEATYLSEIRAEEQLCSKTRFYGESSVTRLLAGYVFKIKDGHPNSNYNGVEYLIIEVSHEGRHLDTEMSRESRRTKQPTAQYRNSFVAIDATEQYRPPRKTPKPRFFGTMTAFVYAETGTKNAEVDLEGRYRVHLPFDRADGTRDSTDPNRKASTWIRMAQPYVGQDQGMYFPLADGTEVLLTFINGDPDQPIISSALPNASQPSLLTSEMNLQRTITAQVSQTVSGNTHTISMNSARLALLEDPPSEANPTGLGSSYINESLTQASVNGTPANPPAPAIAPVPPSPSMIPPWTGKPLTELVPPSSAYDENLIKFKLYDKDFNGTDMTQSDIDKVSTDRGAGDNYVYANARTFAYPQHERVYFIGTFHEDFHVKDDFLDEDSSWTGEREEFHFPAPGGNADQFVRDASGEKVQENGKDKRKTEAEVNPDGIRGVSEDKRWGDQMTYAWGRVFNWAGGPAMGDGGSQAVYNYGNGYTESLVAEMGGTSEDADFPLKDHRDKMLYDSTNGWSPADDAFGSYAGWPGFAAKAVGWVNGVIKWAFDYPDSIIHARHLPTEGLRAARRLFPGDTVVEKTFGNTYAYQAGLAVDIHEGHSISRRYGDAEEVVTGDDCAIVHGDKYETVVGNANTFTMGITNETFVGVAFEWKLAGESSVRLAAESSIHFGAKFESFWGAQLGLKMGPDTQLGTETLKFWKLKGDIAATDLNDKIVALEKKATMLNNAAIEIAKRTIKLDAGEIEVGNKKLKMD